MKDAITDVPGITVGHAQDIEGGTGCSVIICREGAVAGVDVRGSAPCTREVPLLDPVNAVERVHAVYLSGGSGFGLGGAAGVMAYLDENGIGLETAAGLAIVPIVVGASLYDLVVGKLEARPDREMGYGACKNASDTNSEQGNIGAGTGATVGKAGDPFGLMKGGLGTASLCTGDLVVGAIVAVNCFGDVIDPATGQIVAGNLNAERNGFTGSAAYLVRHPFDDGLFLPDNTTIGAVATNAKLSKSGATKVAMMAHDGLARAINPVHTMNDGDAVFCMSTGEVQCNLTALGTMAAEVTARAILNAVRAADTLYGIPCCRDINGQ